MTRPLILPSQRLPTTNLLRSSRVTALGVLSSRGMTAATVLTTISTPSGSMPLASYSGQQTAFRSQQLQIINTIPPLQMTAQAVPSSPGMMFAAASMRTSTPSGSTPQASDNG